MDAILSDAQQFISENQTYAMLMVALIAFGESLFIIGFVIPATALMVAFGGLIGSGTLDAWPIILWSTIGATLGDAVSYWIGRWFGPAMMKWRIVQKYRRMMIATRIFFIRFGFVSVFMGRFVGPVRSTVPLVAGVMSMPQVPFQIANATSALLWSVTMLVPGWLAGRSASFFNPETPLQWIVLMLVFTGVILGSGALVGRYISRRGRRDPVAARAAARSALRGAGRPTRRPL